VKCFLKGVNANPQPLRDATNPQSFSREVLSENRFRHAADGVFPNRRHVWKSASSRDWSYIWRLRARLAGISRTDRRNRYFWFGLSNTGRGLAKFPSVRFKRDCGLSPNHFGLDGKGNVGVPLRPSDYDWVIFGGGVDHSKNYTACATLFGRSSTAEPQNFQVRNLPGRNNMRGNSNRDDGKSYPAGLGILRIRSVRYRLLTGDQTLEYEVIRAMGFSKVQRRGGAWELVKVLGARLGDVVLPWGRLLQLAGGSNGPVRRDQEVKGLAS
jgi:hypothetical protein